MPFLGTTPNQGFTSHVAPQSFSSSANGSTTVFTLNRAVASENDLEVFVGNVRQEPGSGKSYTASGTTLTFDVAPPAGSNVYVNYKGQAQITTTPLDGSVSSQKLDTNIAISGNLTVGGTTTLTVPHFFAIESSNHSINNTDVTISNLTKVSDSHGGFSGHTYTIPAGLGGIWCFNTGITFTGIGSGAWALLTLNINGSDANQHQNYITSGVTNQPFRGTHIGNFTAGQAVTFVAHQGSGSSKNTDSSVRPGFFSAWRMGSAIT